MGSGGWGILTAIMCDCINETQAYQIPAAFYEIYQTITRSTLPLTWQFHQQTAIHSKTNRTRYDGPEARSVASLSVSVRPSEMVIGYPMTWDIMYVSTYVITMYTINSPCVTNNKCTMCHPPARKQIILTFQHQLMCMLQKLLKWQFKNGDGCFPRTVLKTWRIPQPPLYCECYVLR